MRSKPSYSSFIELIGGDKDVWVTLYDDLFICLIGADPYVSDGFLAKFIPCGKNATVYKIAYDKIKALRKGKRDAS